MSEREQPNTPGDGAGAGTGADEASGSLASRAVRGTAWVAGAQLSGKLLFFLSTIILARVLDQEDFGVAAYAVTLIALMSAIPALGIGPASPIGHVVQQRILRAVIQPLGVRDHRRAASALGRAETQRVLDGAHLADPDARVVGAALDP